MQIFIFCNILFVIYESYFVYGLIASSIVDGVYMSPTVDQSYVVELPGMPIYPPDDGIWNVSESDNIAYDTGSMLSTQIELVKPIDNDTYDIEKYNILESKRHFIEFMVSYSSMYVAINHENGDFNVSYQNYTHSTNVRYESLKTKRFDVSFCLHNNGLTWIWYSHFRVFYDDQESYCGYDHVYPGCRTCDPQAYFWGCKRIRRYGGVNLSFAPFRRSTCYGPAYYTSSVACEKGIYIGSVYYKDDIGDGPKPVSSCRKHFLTMDHESVCTVKYHGRYVTHDYRKHRCGSDRVAVYVDGNDHLFDRFTFMTFMPSL